MLSDKNQGISWKEVVAKHFWNMCKSVHIFQLDGQLKAYAKLNHENKMLREELAQLKNDSFDKADEVETEHRFGWVSDGGNVCYSIEPSVCAQRSGQYWKRAPDLDRINLKGES